MDRFQSLIAITLAIVSAGAQLMQPAVAQRVNPAQCLAELPKGQQVGALNRRSSTCEAVGLSAKSVGSESVTSTRGGTKHEIRGDSVEKAPQYKYVVGIAYKVRGVSNICTGTLLTRDIVLTAGHCGCGDTGSYRVTQQLRMDAPGFIAVRGNPVLMDEQICRRGTILPGYDLALLRLATPAVVDTESYEPIPPLVHALRDELRSGLKLKIVGYGLDNSLRNGTRLETDVPIYSPDCAWLRYAIGGCAPFLEMILADTEAGMVSSKAADTCKGDSGGPVFLMRTMAAPLTLQRPSTLPSGPSPASPTTPTSSTSATDHTPARPVGEHPAQRPPSLTVQRAFLVAVTSRPAPLPHFDESNHCGGGGIYTLIGRTDVLWWLQRNGVGNP